MKALWARHINRLVWGFSSQVCSSLTNLALSVMAARVLGPAGLGAVFVGFSFYLLAWGLHRAIVMESLVTTSSSLKNDQLKLATSCALSAVILLGIGMAILMMASSLIVSRMVGEAFLWFGIWLVPCLIQDFVRVVLFRDGQESMATLTDAVWAFSMIVTSPLVWSSASIAAIVCWWGLGALGGAAIGVWRTELRLVGPAALREWWIKTSWPVARWLLAENVAYSALSQTATFALLAIVGPGPLGGLRAVSSVFAPLTLITPAIALPGLPALSAMVDRDPRRAYRISWGLSLAAVGAAAAYLIAAVALGTALLTALFGGEFRRFENLILPIGISQILLAASTGSTLLLKAARRTKRLAFLRALTSSAHLLVLTLMAVSLGISGASWGVAIVAAFSTGLIIVQTHSHVFEPRVSEKDIESS